MESVIFYGVIVLIVLSYLFDVFADMLNDQARMRTIPENVKDVYDHKEYKTWLKYSTEINRMKSLKRLLAFFFVTLMLLNGGFQDIAVWTREITNANIYLETLVFLGILFLIQYLYNLPFSIYFTFSIEERYGFNKATRKTFITDKIKSFILSIVFGGGIILLLTVIYAQTGNLFVLIAFMAFVLIFLFINMTYTSIWVPLFNTLTPLEDSDLKTKIEAFAQSQAYEIKKIQVMDASKRSTKLNAFFSGFGKFKNVVLFDTLLDKMEDDQIVSVLAHEIGHAKHKDIIRNMAMSFVTLAVTLGLLYGFLSADVFYQAFGFDQLHLGFMLLIFMFVISPIGMFIGILSNYASRKAEYKADYFAASNTDAKSMIAALKILSKENFSNLTPHALYVFLYYSHPPVSDRISHIAPLLK
ncbi:MAG: M48 family metallopeptidase [Bacillota bacterium]